MRVRMVVFEGEGDVEELARAFAGVLGRPGPVAAEEIPQIAEAWRPAETAPEGVIVETKVDDADGVRNVQTLKRGGNLWWTPDGSMYVYYTPTHWRKAKP